MNSIVSVVSKYVDLNKRGHNYFGICPFHDEKTPSFSVLSTRGIFHCFGCGKEGDSSEFQRLITQELNDWLYKIDKK
jgi:DNA primase